MARRTKKMPKAREPSPASSDSEPLTEPADAIDPYTVLSLEKTATQEQVKTAYRKAALRHHPDKADPQHKDEANKKFQEVATAYAILSDEKRRRRYDTTGNISESLDDDDFDWTDFFRQQSEAVVNDDMIQQIKNEYQGSSEEREDLLKAYKDGEGDMDYIYEMVMCSNVMEDDERFRQYIDEAIKAGTVKKYSRYSCESKEEKRQRIKKAKDEEQEAMQLAKELGIQDKLFGKSSGTGGTKAAAGGEDTLKALIQQRQKGREENFFDQLEAKYGGGKKKKRSSHDEPPEELFQRNAKKSKVKKGY